MQPYEGQKRIEDSIRDFYKKTYPALSSNKESAFVAAIRAIQSSYARNYDPSMKVSWKNFPNNQVRAAGSLLDASGVMTERTGTTTERSFPGTAVSVIF